jgi:hypothetical protein
MERRIRRDARRFAAESWADEIVNEVIYSECYRIVTYLLNEELTAHATSPYSPPPFAIETSRSLAEAVPFNPIGLSVDFQPSLAYDAVRESHFTQHSPFIEDVQSPIRSVDQGVSPFELVPDYLDDPTVPYSRPQSDLRKRPSTDMSGYTFPPLYVPPFPSTSPVPRIPSRSLLSPNHVEHFEPLTGSEDDNTYNQLLPGLIGLSPKENDMMYSQMPRGITGLPYPSVNQNHLSHFSHNPQSRISPLPPQISQFHPPTFSYSTHLPHYNSSSFSSNPTHPLGSAFSSGASFGHPHAVAPKPSGGITASNLHQYPKHHHSTSRLYSDFESNGPIPLMPRLGANPAPLHYRTLPNMSHSSNRTGSTHHDNPSRGMYEKLPLPDYHPEAARYGPPGFLQSSDQFGTESGLGMSDHTTAYLRDAAGNGPLLTSAVRDKLSHGMHSMRDTEGAYSRDNDRMSLLSDTGVTSMGITPGISHSDPKQRYGNLALPRTTGPLRPELKNSFNSYQYFPQTKAPPPRVSHPSQPSQPPTRGYGPPTTTMKAKPTSSIPRESDVWGPIDSTYKRPMPQTRPLLTGLTGNSTWGPPIRHDMGGYGRTSPFRSSNSGKIDDDPLSIVDSLLDGEPEGQWDHSSNISSLPTFDDPFRSTHEETFRSNSQPNSFRYYSPTETDYGNVSGDQNF